VGIAEPAQKWRPHTQTLSKYTVNSAFKEVKEFGPSIFLGKVKTCCG